MSDDIDLDTLGEETDEQLAAHLADEEPNIIEDNSEVQILDADAPKEA